MQDQDLDTSSDNDLDTSGDTNGGSSDEDKLESGGQTSDATDDAGDDGGSEPDQEGYTAEDRQQLESMRSRMKAKDDKISQDGQRIKALETEVERLKERQDDRSEAQDRDAQRTDSRERRTYRRPPSRRADNQTDTNGEDTRETPQFSAADIRRLPREQQRIYASMWEMADRANKRAEEAEARLTEVENYQSTEQRAKSDEAQYQEYRNHYGLTREQYDEVMQARSEGDHFTADRLLNVHSAAANRRRERAETMTDDSQFLPPGSPDTPAPTRRETPEEQMRKEYEDATTEQQKDEVARKAWATFPADVAERITLPPPSN